MSCKVQGIMSGGKKEGLYAWAKYNPVISSVIINGESVPSNLSNLNQFLSMAVGRPYYDSNYNYLGEYEKSITFDESYYYTIPSSTGLIIAKVIDPSPPLKMKYWEDYTIEYSYDFIDYIVDKSPNKYPNGAVHTDGYYYEKVDGTIKVSNGVLKEGLFALDDINKNEFISYSDLGYTDITVGELDSMSLTGRTGKLIKLRDNYFMLIGSVYCQPFYYDGENFRKGVKTYVGVDQVSWATGDPYELGCAFCGGFDGYTNYYIGYIKVDPDTLECTVYRSVNVTGQSRSYGGYIDFVNENVLIHTSGDYAMGTVRLNRSNYTFTAVTSLQDSNNGTAIKVSDGYYLTWYSGGNTKSWYVCLLKVNSDGSLTTGTKMLIASTSSGIAFCCPILKFEDTGNIYAPTASAYYQIIPNLSDLTCTKGSSSYSIPSNTWSYYNNYWVLSIDGSTKLMWSCYTQTYDSSYTYIISCTYYALTIKEKSGGGLTITKSDALVITNNTRNMDAFPVVDLNQYTGLINNGVKINKFSKYSGYIKSAVGSEIKGIAVNKVNKFSSTLKAYTV